MKKLWLSGIVLALTLWACKRGEPLANKAPDTRISISAINLTGPDRLSTEVTLHWLGSDEDGFVTGYEISFDNQTWHPTTSADSTFLFTLTAGSDTTDIDFWVRAIDDAKEKDPSPAYLRIPIRNTAPTAKFDTARALPDTVHLVATSFWNVSDPDGDETLDSIFIRINNGPWVALSPNISFVSLVPESPMTAGVQNALIYKNADAILDAARLAGFLNEGDNRLYLRVRDQAGAWSETDSTDIFYSKRQTSDLLILDSNAGGSTPTPESIYFPIISAEYGAFDYLDVAANRPWLWSPTFLLYLNLYDKVFWYSDETVLSDGQLYLEQAAGVLQEYLNDGGKLLISTKFPSTFDNGNSAIFQFAPIDSLSSSGGQARIPTDSLVMPEPGFAASYDTLRSSSFITGADPFYPRPSPNATVMFRAQVQKVSGWQGPNVVAAHTTHSSGNINQIFFSVEIHKLFGDPAAMSTFFREVLTNEFNW